MLINNDRCKKAMDNRMGNSQNLQKLLGGKVQSQKRKGGKMKKRKRKRKIWEKTKVGGVCPLVGPSWPIDWNSNFKMLFCLDSRAK